MVKPYQTRTLQHTQENKACLGKFAGGSICYACAPPYQSLYINMYRRYIERFCGKDVTLQKQFIRNISLQLSLIMTVVASFTSYYIPITYRTEWNVSCKYQIFHLAFVTASYLRLLERK